MNNTVFLFEHYLQSLNVTPTKTLTEEYLRYEWKDEKIEYVLDIYDNGLKYFLRLIRTKSGVRGEGGTVSNYHDLIKGLKQTKEVLLDNEYPFRKRVQLTP